MFGSLENERKMREKRENETLKLKPAGVIYINEKLHKVAEGYKTMGVYIDHPKYENTRKPKILAHTRDKVVIPQNGVVWLQIHKINKGRDFAMQDNFSRIVKISLA